MYVTEASVASGIANGSNEKVIMKQVEVSTV
jgi:hypothetical protein